MENFRAQIQNTSLVPVAFSKLPLIFRNFATVLVFRRIAHWANHCKPRAAVTWKASDERPEFDSFSISIYQYMQSASRSLTEVKAGGT
jgi:hypothetical protein